MGATGFAFGVLRFVLGAAGLARAVSVIVVIVRVLVARGAGLGLLVVERWALGVRRLALAGALSPAKPDFASKLDLAGASDLACAPDLAGEPDFVGELPLGRAPPLPGAPPSGGAPPDEAGEDWRLVVFAGPRGALLALGERVFEVDGVASVGFVTGGLDAAVRRRGVLFGCFSLFWLFDASLISF